MVIMSVPSIPTLIDRRALWVSALRSQVMVSCWPDSVRVVCHLPLSFFSVSFEPQAVIATIAMSVSSEKRTFFIFYV